MPGAWAGSRARGACAALLLKGGDRAEQDQNVMEGYRPLDAAPCVAPSCRAQVAETEQLLMRIAHEKSQVVEPKKAQVDEEVKQVRRERGNEGEGEGKGEGGGERERDGEREGEGHAQGQGEGRGQRSPCTYLCPVSAFCESPSITHLLGSGPRLARPPPTPNTRCNSVPALLCPSG